MVTTVTVATATVLTDLITQFTSIIKDTFPAKTTMVQTLVTEIPILATEVPILVMKLPILVTVVRALVTVVTPLQQLIPVIRVAQKIPVTLHRTPILIENVNSSKAVFFFSVNKLNSLTTNDRIINKLTKTSFIL